MEAQECISQLQSDEHAQSGFLANILTPGSSLHRNSLLLLDAAFAALLGVFIVLLFLTRGSIHIFALIGIEGCLWASIKWFVQELRQSLAQQPAPPSSDGLKNKEE